MNHERTLYVRCSTNAFQFVFSIIGVNVHLLFGALKMQHMKMRDMKLLIF